MANELEIPEDLRQRYKHLSSYQPLEVAVTDIYVREWQSLIERIAALEQQVANRDANVSAVLENITPKYLRRVREGGGLEDIYASLALSVVGLDSEVASLGWQPLTPETEWESGSELGYWEIDGFVSVSWRRPGKDDSRPNPVFKYFRRFNPPA